MSEGKIFGETAMSANDSTNKAIMKEEDEIAKSTQADDPLKEMEACNRSDGGATKVIGLSTVFDISAVTALSSSGTAQETLVPAITQTSAATATSSGPVASTGASKSSAVATPPISEAAISSAVFITAAVAEAKDQNLSAVTAAKGSASVKQTSSSTATTSKSLEAPTVIITDTPVIQVIDIEKVTEESVTGDNSTVITSNPIDIDQNGKSKSQSENNGESIIIGSDQSQESVKVESDESVESIKVGSDGSGESIMVGSVEDVSDENQLTITNKSQVIDNFFELYVLHQIWRCIEILFLSSCKL